MAATKKEAPFPVSVNFALAAAAGSSAWMFSHPFEVVKTRMMAQEGRNPNPIRLCMDVGKKEGIRGLYSGLSAGILRQCSYTMLRVGLFNTMTDYFKDKPKNMFNGKVGIGLAAGAIGAGICCPVEVSLVRMAADGQLPVDQRRNYKHVFDAMFRIIKDDGIKGWFRGVDATIARGMLITVLQLGTNEQCKETYKSQFGLTGFPLVFASAMTSSVVVCVGSNPLDVAKVRIQQQKVDPVTGLKPYPNLAACLLKTVANEGPLALMKGLFPWYLRGGSHTVFMFLFLDQYKSIYQKYANFSFSMPDRKMVGV